MADNKKQLLDESSVRKFMKIAGNGKLANDFVKKGLLKEEDSGRGRIFNPHGDDPRHDNLNEEDVTEEGQESTGTGKSKVDLRETDVQEESEVAEEGQDLEEEVQEEGEVQEEAVGSIVSKGPGKAIESGKGMSGSGKKVSKKMQYESAGGKGSLTPKGPGKEIAGGKGMSGAGKKPTKQVQYEGEVQEEGDQLQEMGGIGGDEEMGGGPPMGGDSPMGGEPDGDEPMGGGGDVTGLVQAIADAISQHTGVQVSVEGAGGPEVSGEEPATEAPPEDDGAPMQQEAGMVGYKPEDPKARRMPSGAMQEAKKPAAKAPASKKAPAKTGKNEQMQQMVEAITNKVLSKLAVKGAEQKKAAAPKAPAKK